MNTMGIIFANIYDSSLGELTNKRTMASLPFGGRYRQIDFSLSNMANSGIRHVGIITKYNYQSLMNHIGSGQEWDLELGEGQLEFLTPFAMGHSGSYRGKLEALHSAKEFLELSEEEYVVMADSGVLCSIDFSKVVQEHIESGADVTVVTKAGICDGVKQLDMAVLVDESGAVTDMAVDYCASGDYLASMGVFVLRRDFLIERVVECIARNRYRFERDFLLRDFDEGKLTIHAYRFQNVALFNESTEEFYHNNLAILERKVRFSLFRGENAIYTRPRDEVPAYFGETADAKECIIGDGCTIEGSAEHSVLFRGVHLMEGATVKDCVIMQDAVIEPGAHIECAILDKNVHVRAGSRLIGTYEHPAIAKRGEVV